MYRAVCLFLLCPLVWFVSLVDAYKEHFTVMERRDVFDVCRKDSATSIGTSGRFGRALGRGFAGLKRCFCRSIISGTRQLSGGIMGFCVHTCFCYGFVCAEMPPSRALEASKNGFQSASGAFFLFLCVSSGCVCFCVWASSLMQLCVCPCVRTRVYNYACAVAIFA